MANEKNIIYEDEVNKILEQKDIWGIDLSSNLKKFNFFNKNHIEISDKVIDKVQFLLKNEDKRELNRLLRTTEIMKKSKNNLLIVGKILSLLLLLFLLLSFVFNAGTTLSYTFSVVIPFILFSIIGVIIYNYRSFSSDYETALTCIIIAIKDLTNGY